MRRAILVVSVVVIAGCGGAELRSTQFRGPDGAPDWWSIACRGDNSLCLREAGEVCPHGYDVTDRSNHDDVEARTVVSAHASFATGRTRTSTITNGELTIKCHGPGLALTADELRCIGPDNLRLPTCPRVEEGPPRRFLAEDPREAVEPGK